MKKNKKKDVVTKLASEAKVSYQETIMNAYNLGFLDAQERVQEGIEKIRQLNGIGKIRFQQILDCLGMIEVEDGKPEKESRGE